MLALAVSSAAAVVAAVALAARSQGRRFARRVREDARALFARAAGAASAPAPVEGLPPPVRRYLEVSGAARRAPIATVRLRHGGTFAPKVGGAPLPIRGEQYFTADPPGFVWWGRVPAAPGVWIDARDQVVGGEGNMLVRLESTITLADARGPELDHSALVRLLGELAWLPTALRDPRFVTWTPRDATSATATLRVGGREVSGVFHFGADGLPARFTAERYMDLGGGRSVLRPFVGELSDYRAVDGVLLPFRAQGAWQLEDGPFTYVRWELDELQLDHAAPW
jgi:hypothetical protein